VVSYGKAENFKCEIDSRDEAANVSCISERLSPPRMNEKLKAPSQMRDHSPAFQELGFTSLGLDRDEGSTQELTNFVERRDRA
jgi:hypothetical protein